MEMQSQSSVTWPAVAVVGSAAVVVATIVWTAPQTSMWYSVSTTPAATQVVQPVAIRSQQRSALAAAQTELSVTMPARPRIFQVDTSATAPTFSTWSVPLVGAVGILAAAVAGFFLNNQSRESTYLLQPLMMVGVAATYSMKAPAEALALWQKEGYTILDVRSEMEGADGRIRSNNKGSIDIPMINAKGSFDPSAGKKVVKQELNSKFMEQVKARIPKDAKVIVMCSDGTNRTSQALDLLTAEGYRSVVGMTGGFNKFNQLFDRSQQPRDKASQETRAATLKDPVDWLRWAGAGGSWAATSSPAPSAGASASSTPSPYSDPAFQKATIAAFPAQANATVEEARVLWKLDGYSLVDIRSEMEGADGRVRGPNKGSIDIPMINAKSVYDSNLGKKVVSQEANKDFLAQMKARFPEKSSKIIIMCSDGTTRSAEALDVLAAEGYTNLVLLRGGFNRWDQLFDKQLSLRSPAQQAAKAEWLDDPIEWVKWTSAVGKSAPPRRSVAATAAPASRTIRPTISQGTIDDPQFQQSTMSAFPSRSNATVEESRVLWKTGGYSILDIRSEMEGADGRIRGPNKGTIDIPLFGAKSMYDSTLGTRVVTQEANKKWLEQVKARFPADSKIIVMCSDGTNRSAQALDLLAAAGYSNLVLMRGGYNRWDQVFDKQLGVRNAAQQAQKAEWLDDPIEWAKWTGAVGMSAPPHRAVAATAAPATRTVRDIKQVGAFMDPIFQANTMASFPAKLNANVEEARVLWKTGGYSIVDLRSEMEGADGRIRGPNKGTIDIPMVTAKASFDSALGKKVVKQEANRQWLSQMKARFPKDSKIILMCSDSGKRTGAALKALQAEGYKNVVVMVGGYNKWDQLFDRGLGVRTAAAQAAKAATLQDPIQWSL